MAKTRKRGMFRLTLTRLGSLLLLVWGIWLLSSARLDGKLLGTVFMIYAAVGDTVDSLAIGVFEGLEDIEERLAKIEALLVERPK